VLLSKIEFKKGSGKNRKKERLNILYLSSQKRKLKHKKN